MRSATVLLALCTLLPWLGPGLLSTLSLYSNQLFADEPAREATVPSQTEPSKTTTAKPDDAILKQMRERVQNMEVRFPDGKDGTLAELRTTPLIHYSDQIRNLPESTLWVWHIDQVPVLFCKVERMENKQTGAVTWQYCCVPTSLDKADVTWKRDYRWRAKDPGFKWIAVADMPAPHRQEGLRLTQLRDIARNFVGEVTGGPGAGSQQSTLLPRPLHRFASPETKVLDGAVFGLTSNGTNPDVLLIVEALKEPMEGSPWRFAVVGMTGDEVSVKFKNKSVWSKPYTKSPGDHKTWLWYLSAK